MEELTDKRGNPLKDSLTLQWLLQVYSHVLPVSQPSTIVVCLQVTWKEKKKIQEVFCIPGVKSLGFHLHGDVSQQRSRSLAVRGTHISTSGAHLIAQGSLQDAGPGQHCN